MTCVCMCVCVCVCVCACVYVDGWMDNLILSLNYKKMLPIPSFFFS